MTIGRTSLCSWHRFHTIPREKSNEFFRTQKSQGEIFDHSRSCIRREREKIISLPATQNWTVISSVFVYWRHFIFRNGIRLLKREWNSNKFCRCTRTLYRTGLPENFAISFPTLQAIQPLISSDKILLYKREWGLAGVYKITRIYKNYYV